ncbi:hypothetical protein WJ970_12770 [Achromobacter xylosoxidans]
MQEIGAMMQALKREGEVALVLVEQNLRLAARVVDRYYMLRAGQVVAQGVAAGLARDQEHWRGSITSSVAACWARYRPRAGQHGLPAMPARGSTAWPLPMAWTVSSLRLVRIARPLAQEIPCDIGIMLLDFYI